MRTLVPHLVAAVAAASVLPGCLSNVYKLPKQDLQQLTYVEPGQRGQSVRVVQEFAGSDGPPPAERVDGSVHVGVYVDATPGPAPRPYRPARASNAAKTSKDDAKVLLVLAAVVAVGLAATEGARFNGWAELHPMHPVHLFGYDGRYMVVPLAHITPEHAAWAQKAVIRETEGPMRRLSRAPLDRTGLTYSLLFGQGEVGSSANNADVGFQSHIQLGVFPVHNVGILYDLGMGWSDDEFGDTVFELRNSLEVQVFPAAVGRLHAGVFGQIGLGRRLDDSLKGSDVQGVIYGGGGLVQLDVTTTLAITARAGATLAYGEPTRDFTLGISIY